MNGIPLRSIPDLWANTVDKFPGKPAVVFAGQTMTYADVELKAGRLARRLRDEYGVKKGTHVALAMPNCLEFYLSYWAAMRLGATLVPLNTRLLPDGMAFVMGDAEADVLIGHEEFWGKLREALPSCPRVRGTLLVGQAQEGTESFEEQVSSGDPLPYEGGVTEEDLASIVYTSGTTGKPKGAIILHGNLLFNVKNTIIPHSFRHEDIHLLVVPLFHCTGLNSIVPTSCYLGSTVILAPRPNIQELVDLIEEHRCTTFLGVPTLFYFLTALKDLSKRDLTSLRLIAYSGSPMPPQTIRRLKELLPWVKLHNFFGLTETISITNVLPDVDALARPESIGKVLPDVGQCILDDAGNRLPANTIGELCFRKENVISSYWKRPGLLEEAMSGDWFRTGDYALVDEEGYVYLKGRKKEMIIVGGENVYAVEVENVIVGHEAVLEVAVVGVEAKGPQSYLGELVKAVVVLKEGFRVSELDLKRHCAERLPRYKVPQIVEFRDVLPRSPSGKVLKQELKGARG